MAPHVRNADTKVPAFPGFLVYPFLAAGTDGHGPLWLLSLSLSEEPRTGQTRQQLKSLPSYLPSGPRPPGTTGSWRDRCLLIGTIPELTVALPSVYTQSCPGCPPTPECQGQQHFKSMLVNPDFPVHTAPEERFFISLASCLVQEAAAPWVHCHS